MAKLHGYSKNQILDLYQKMFTSRKLDEKMLILLKQGKSFFHIGASGHEAAQLAAANLMKPNQDWSFPYYRDGAFCIGIGMTPKEQLLSFLARADDPNSGGRQMPQHYGHKKLRIVSQSSPTGTQFLQAVGCALARKMSKTDDIVYVSSGEGTTSQGDFHEAINWASNAKAPVIFHIQDNEYAISTHRSDQMADTVYAMTSGYKNLARYNVDGSDYFETSLAFKESFLRARKGKGPSVVISNVVRLLPHSSSDDQRKYRLEKALKEDLKKDPLKKLEEECLKANFIPTKEFEKIRDAVSSQIDIDAEWAEAQDHPDPDTALDHIYSDFSFPKEKEYKSI